MSGELTDRLFASLLFAMQGVRGGVSPGLIREASTLLDAPRERVTDHLRGRLVHLHGPAAAEDDWLLRRPPTTRETLRPVMERARQENPAYTLELRKTSGSTGTPFAFVKDREMTARMAAAMWAVYQWHGVNPGAREARFWGMPTSSLRRQQRWLKDFFLHRRRLGAFYITAERCARHYHLLRRFRPTFAYGYPTLLRVFADECARMGLSGADLHLRAVITTGEMLTPATRAALADFFACRVINEYGCTESGVLSIECEYQTPHAIPFAALAEVAAPGGGPLPAAGSGEVLVTDLYGRFAQLLRYRLHDIASSGSHGCPCGRDLPVLSPASGRIDAFIETPHRGRVYDAILAYSMPAEVQRFRAYQQTIDTLHLEVVAGMGFHPRRTVAECKQRLEDALGPGVTVTIEVVDSLSHELGGKLRYFVPVGGR